MARILIIDNERPIRANLRRFLALEGHRVMEADDGAGGLELAAIERPDLVLCDLLMPTVDGFTVLRELRASPHTAAIPLVFLTASAEREVAEDALRAGADGYVVKPFRLDALREVVSRALATA